VTRRSLLSIVLNWVNVFPRLSEHVGVCPGEVSFATTMTKQARPAVSEMDAEVRKSSAPPRVVVVRMLGVVSAI
jgi:hypothetical protein